MSKLRKYFSNLKPKKPSNLKVVALCVLTATTFWLLNALNKDGYTTVVRQPIGFSFDQEEFMAVEELPSQISIEVNGNGWDLLRKYFKFQSTPFVIELEDPSKNGYALARNFQRDLSELLAPTQLVNFVQDTIAFRIDKIVSRKIAILPDTSENILSNNFRFASDIKIDPDQVTVRGPISKLQDLDGKWMVDLGEQNINKSFSKLLPLTVPRELRQYLSLDEESVLISFDVVEYLEGSKDLKITKRYFPSNVTIADEDASVKLTYLVDERKVEDLEKINLEAVLNYNNRNREDSTVAVTLNTSPPPYLENIAFEPPIFDLIYD